MLTLTFFHSFKTTSQCSLSRHLKIKTQAHALKNTTTNQYSSTATKVQPIVELREYNLHPEFSVPYLQHTTAASDLRKSLTPLRLFTTPETGGILHVATHFYYYGNGYTERNEKRKVMGQSSEWKEYLSKVRPYTQTQSSLIFVEAPLVSEIPQVHGLSSLPSTTNTDAKMVGGSDPIYEIRRYKLRLGYDTVPNFLSLYENGLPSKLHAPGNDPSTTLVTLLYNEVGRLNEVIEIWRHGDGTAAMERSRMAARGAIEWRNAIKDIAGLAIQFNNVIHKPVVFSPFQ